VREFRTLGSVRGAGRNRTRPAKASPYRDRGLLPLRVELPAKAPQRTSRSLGDAQVQTIEGQVSEGLGVAQRHNPAGTSPVRPLGFVLITGDRPVGAG
jgi:hypothetical protein